MVNTKYLPEVAPSGSHGRYPCRDEGRTGVQGFLCAHGRCSPQKLVPFSLFELEFQGRVIPPLAVPWVQVLNYNALRLKGRRLGRS